MNEREYRMNMGCAADQIFNDENREFQRMVVSSTTFDSDVGALFPVAATCKYATPPRSLLIKTCVPYQLKDTTDII